MTATQQLLNKVLSEQGVTLAELVRYNRRKGMTWEQISRDLHDSTGITVSRESLRSWFGRKRKAAA